MQVKTVLKFISKVSVGVSILVFMFYNIVHIYPYPLQLIQGKYRSISISKLNCNRFQIAFIRI